jgi:general secretion pathway protein I
MILRARRRQRGFTLLEMLVATTLMAVAVVSLLSALSTSLRNAARLTDHDRAAIVARRKLDELLLTRRLPRFQTLQGPLNALNDAGLTGGWTARVTPFEVPPNLQPGFAVLDRVECEIWWLDGTRRRSFKLDGYKTTILETNDVAGGAIQ